MLTSAVCLCLECNTCTGPQAEDRLSFSFKLLQPLSSLQWSVCMGRVQVQNIAVGLKSDRAASVSMGASA